MCVYMYVNNILVHLICVDVDNMNIMMIICISLASSLNTGRKRNFKFGVQIIIKHLRSVFRDG